MPWTFLRHAGRVWLRLAETTLLNLEGIDSYKIIYSVVRLGPSNVRISLKTLVGAAGLEPATLCLEGGGCIASQMPYFQAFRFL